MRRRLFRICVTAAAALILLSLFRVSDRALVPAGSPEDRPGYIADDAVIASVGGLALSYAEYRYLVYEALGTEFGLQPSEADLMYDEVLLSALPELALHRAALRRAVSLMAMEEELTVPEPSASVVEALCREPYMSSGLAFGEYSYNALRSLLYLKRYGADSMLYPAEDAVAWGNANGVVRVRVLRLSADREKYSAAEIEDRFEQLGVFLSQLRQGETDFDTLCSVYSEKTESPEGTQLLPSSPEREICSAALSTAENDWAVCRTEKYVCLVMRLPLLADMETGDAPLRTLAAQSAFSSELEKSADSLKITYRRLWKKIRLSRMF